MISWIRLAGVRFRTLDKQTDKCVLVISIKLNSRWSCVNKDSEQISIYNFLHTITCKRLLLVWAGVCVLGLFNTQPYVADQCTGVTHVFSNIYLSIYSFENCIQLYRLYCKLEYCILQISQTYTTKCLQFCKPLIGIRIVWEGVSSVKRPVAANSEFLRECHSICFL